MKVTLSSDVAQAFKQGRAVVALESSVICQGLPAPHNLNAALACEAAIRDTGAVPATIAVVAGEIRVGLSAEELKSLASSSAPMHKLGSRELALAVAQRQTGGTTVSATCEVAFRAGISVFATGGIGGVHRGDLDVSSDLWALSRFPVGVVCAGAKSVLDLPRTVEALEALAVPVLGVATDEFPAFYCRSSGLPVSGRVESAAEAAAVVSARKALEQGGVLFALPPPQKTALDPKVVESWVSKAISEAEQEGVRGKDVTPFLLRKVAALSEGKALAANLALLENNARFAAEVAVAMAAGF